MTVTHEDVLVTVCERNSLLNYFLCVSHIIEKLVSALTDMKAYKHRNRKSFFVQIIFVAYQLMEDIL